MVVNYLKYSYSFWKSIFSAIYAVVRGALNAVRNIFNSVTQALVNTIRSRGGNIKSTFSSIAATIRNVLTGIAKSAYNWGANLMSMFGKGIKNKIKELKGMALSAVREIKNILGFSSPTKEGPGKTADKWAPNLMDMFIDGIQSRQQKLAMQSKITAAMLVPNASMPNLGNSGGNGDVVITGNSIVSNDLVQKLMNNILRTIKNRGR
jgi:phage-related protein